MKNLNKSFLSFDVAKVSKISELCKYLSRNLYFLNTI